MKANLSENPGCFAIHTIVPMVLRTRAVVSKVHILETVQGIETIKLVKRLHGWQERTATFRRKFLNALGVQAVRFKTILVDKELSLRICRLWDLPRLKTRLVPGLFLQAAGRQILPFRSLFSFRNWLNSTFNLLYLIAAEEHGSQRTIGFIGLYGIRSEDSLWLSLAIFDADDRRRGYGARAVQLVTDSLQHEAAIKRVCVEVAKRNYASLSFFQACSFRLKSEAAGHRRLTFYEDSPGLRSN
ncbi:MAG: GNAT family protein [Deltaproteobacteria bacterium]|jgi:RimJ/RimL family protein N-acetyltransferase